MCLGLALGRIAPGTLVGYDGCLLVREAVQVAVQPVYLVFGGSETLKTEGEVRAVRLAGL